MVLLRPGFFASLAVKSWCARVIAVGICNKSTLVIDLVAFYVGSSWCREINSGAFKMLTVRCYTWIKGGALRAYWFGNGGRNGVAVGVHDETTVGCRRGVHGSIDVYSWFAEAIRFDTCKTILSSRFATVLVGAAVGCPLGETTGRRRRKVYGGIMISSWFGRAMR